jgi:hypothetical protein
VVLDHLLLEPLTKNGRGLHSISFVALAFTEGAGKGLKIALRGQGEGRGGESAVEAYFVLSFSKRVKTWEALMWASEPTRAILS